MTIFIHSGNYGKKLNAPIKISKKKNENTIPFLFYFYSRVLPILQIFYTYPYFEQSILYAYVYFLHTIKYYILLHQTSQFQIFNFIYYCTSQFFTTPIIIPTATFFSHKCIIFYHFIFPPYFSANVISPYEHHNFQCIISV